MPRRTLPAVLATAALALAACSSSGGDGSAAAAAATPTIPTLDGTQEYGDLVELTKDMAERGIDCTRLETDANPARTAAQGRCYIDGEEIVLQLWDSAVERDDGTSEIITIFLNSDLPYCFVLGRSGGAWSVNAGDDMASCGRIAKALGGERFDENT